MRVFGTFLNDFVCGINKEGNLCYSETHSIVDELDDHCDAGSVTEEACQWLEDRGCCFASLVEVRSLHAGLLSRGALVES